MVSPLFYAAGLGGAAALFTMLLSFESAVIKWLARVVLKLLIFSLLGLGLYILATYDLTMDVVIMLGAPLATTFAAAYLAVIIIMFILRFAPRFKGGTVPYEKPSDIRSMPIDKRRFTHYDVMQYQKKGHITFGLRADSLKSFWRKPVPVTMPLAAFFDRHVQIMGTTGSGKTVTIQMLFRQLIRWRHPVVVINPKAEDNYLPYCLYKAAKQAGVPYHYINLNADQLPQINLFIGANEYEICQLLESTFDLQDKGRDADFHRGADRDACVSAAKLLLTSPSFASVYPLLGVEAPEGFRRKFREMAGLQSINALDIGVDIADICNSNGVIYIDGSVSSAVVRQAMTLVVTKISQIMQRRTPRGRYPTVSLFLDEFKYVCSSTVLEILSTLRSKGLHLLIAHQSAADFLDIPGSDGAAVAGIATDNTDIKQIYNIKDAETRELLCRSWGYRTVHTENKTEEGSTYVEHQGYYIDPNTLATLPTRFAVTSGVHQLAQIVLTSPQQAPDNSRALRITELPLAGPSESKDNVVDIKAKKHSGRLSNYEFNL